MKAIPQLTTITANSGDSLNRRWPYQATVMNKFDAISIRTGSIGRDGRSRHSWISEADRRGYHWVLRLHIPDATSGRRTVAIHGLNHFRTAPLRRNSDASRLYFFCRDRFHGSVSGLRGRAAASSTARSGRAAAAAAGAATGAIAA